MNRITGPTKSYSQQETNAYSIDSGKRRRKKKRKKPKKRRRAKEK